MIAPMYVQAWSRLCAYMRAGLIAPVCAHIRGGMIAPAYTGWHDRAFGARELVGM